MDSNMHQIYVYGLKDTAQPTEMLLDGDILVILGSASCAQPTDLNTLPYMDTAIHHI